MINNTRCSMWLGGVIAIAGTVYCHSAFGQATMHDPFVGTWKLNLDRSIFDPGPPPQSQTRIYKDTPEGLEATITTVDALGNIRVAEYVAGYDQVNYPFVGSRLVDAIELNRTDPYTAQATLRHGGDIVGTARRIVTTDGSIMTFTIQLGDNRNFLVFDRVP